MSQEKNQKKEPPMEETPMPEELRKSMNAAVKRAVERIRRGGEEITPEDEYGDAEVRFRLNQKAVQQSHEGGLI